MNASSLFLKVMLITHVSEQECSKFPLTRYPHCTLGACLVLHGLRCITAFSILKYTYCLLNKRSFPSNSETWFTFCLATISVSHGIISALFGAYGESKEIKFIKIHNTWNLKKVSDIQGKIHEKWDSDLGDIPIKIIS